MQGRNPCARRCAAQVLAREVPDVALCGRSDVKALACDARNREAATALSRHLDRVNPRQVR